MSQANGNGKSEPAKGEEEGLLASSPPPEYPAKGASPVAPPPAFNPEYQPPPSYPGYPQQAPSPGYPQQAPTPGYPGGQAVNFPSGYIPQAPYPGYALGPTQPGYQPAPVVPGHTLISGYPVQHLLQSQSPFVGVHVPTYLSTVGAPSPGLPGAPVTSQPTAAAAVVPWMEPPQGNFDCAPGLQYLTLIDQLLVKQKIKLAELMTGIGLPNEYSIVNTMNQHVYEAVEVSSFLAQNCFCRDKRTFDIKIYDNFRNMIMHFHRPRSCQACCFPCCLQHMEVTAPPGTLVGTIDQRWSLLNTKLEVKDARGKVKFIITGPACCNCSCSDVEFPVTNVDGEQVGAITKQWTGWVQESYSDADNFSVSFPMDLDVKMKAVLLGACFLIDFMFFENCAVAGGPQNNRRR